jgi:uncharacterized membrane protein
MTPSTWLTTHVYGRFQSQWRHPTRRRLWAAAIGLGALLLMAFYTLSDAAHLAHSHVLHGADWLGYAVCHRLPGRSFMIAGRQFPLCARCTGMYLGVALTILFTALNGRLRRADLPRWPVMILLVFFLGALGIDGLNSYSHFFPEAPHLYTPRNWLRLLTGLGVGLAMGLFILPALMQTLWRRPHYRPIVASLRDLVPLLLVTGAAFLLLLSNQPLILYVMAIVSAAGLWALLGAINTVFGLFLLRREGRARRWRETAVPLLLGLILAAAELSAISWIRFSLTGVMTGFPGLS